MNPPTRVADVQDRKRILFVDDEPQVLSGFKRMLYPMRDEWAAFFAVGAADALDFLSREPADLVVSDLRMPGINGVEFLSAVKTRWPRTIRFVLSGCADRFMILRCAGPAHQFLSKPCDAESLVKAIRRAFSLRERVRSIPVLRFAESCSHLPPMPGLYAMLASALDSPDSTLDSICGVLERDAVLASKMLRLVTSAFFGYVDSIRQAASYLGAEAMGAVALASSLFDQYLGGPDEFGLAECLDHSTSVGAVSGRWILRASRDRKAAEEATMSGLLHDVGKLVFARNRPDDTRRVAPLAAARSIPLHAAECEIFGVSHAEIGAYLLDEWGVADNVVEAVAFHHRPSDAHVREPNSLFAVHAANALCHKRADPGGRWETLLDVPFLSAVDPAWSIDAFDAASEQS